MKVNKLSLPGVGSRGHILFSESGHVAYQINVEEV